MIPGSDIAPLRTERQRPTVPRLQRAMVLSVAFLLSPIMASCGGGAPEPEPSLVGTWDLIGFSDGGVTATTTGTAVFRPNATFSIEGAVTFPGEPTDSIKVDGTFKVSGNSVDLAIDEQTTTWILDFSDSQVMLTEVEPPPANTITLRRRL